MKSDIIAGWAVVLTALVLSDTLLAHHAATMFETTTPIRVKGTVATLHVGQSPLCDPR